MLAFIIRRVFQSVIVVLTVGFVAFAMFRFVGDPIENMLGQERTQADVDRMRAELGLDEPFPVQYLFFLQKAASGDFGISYTYKQDVLQLFAERAPATLELALVSGIFAVIIGIALGVYAAISRSRARARPPGWALPAEALVSVLGVTVFRGLLGEERSVEGEFARLIAPELTWPWLISFVILPLSLLLLLRLLLHPSSRAPTIMTGSLIGVSLPTFLIGVLLIYAFAVELSLLPSSRRRGTVDLGGWETSLLTVEGWRYLVMPAITLGLYQMTLIMRLVRSEMLEVLRADYIRFARARGLPERAIHFGHALKNTLVPVITIIGLQFGAIIAFAIITETVFQWPGLGFMFIKAVQSVDIPIMAAYLMLISVLFVTINLLVDILYLAIDPRLRVDRAAAR